MHCGECYTSDDFSELYCGYLNLITFPSICNQAYAHAKSIDLRGNRISFLSEREVSRFSNRPLYIDITNQDHVECVYTDFYTTSILVVGACRFSDMTSIQPIEDVTTESPFNLDLDLPSHPLFNQRETRRRDNAPPRPVNSVRGHGDVMPRNMIMGLFVTALITICLFLVCIFLISAIAKGCVKVKAKVKPRRRGTQVNINVEPPVPRNVRYNHRETSSDDDDLPPYPPARLHFEDEDDTESDLPPPPPPHPPTSPARENLLTPPRTPRRSKRLQTKNEKAPTKKRTAAPFRPPPPSNIDAPSTSYSHLPRSTKKLKKTASFSSSDEPMEVSDGSANEIVSRPHNIKKGRAVKSSSKGHTTRTRSKTPSRKKRNGPK